MSPLSGVSMSFAIILLAQGNNNNLVPGDPLTADIEATAMAQEEK